MSQTFAISMKRLKYESITRRMKLSAAKRLQPEEDWKNE
jgi:hypothetical protein